MHRDPCDDSPTSSPLTSLSSLDDGSELLDQNLHDKLYSIDDIEAAQVPFPFQNVKTTIEEYPRSYRHFTRVVSARLQLPNMSYTYITTWSPILLHNLPQPQRSLSQSLSPMAHDRPSARCVTFVVATTVSS